MPSCDGNEECCCERFRESETSLEWWSESIAYGVLRDGRIAVDVVWRQRHDEGLMRLPWFASVVRLRRVNGLYDSVSMNQSVYFRFVLKTLSNTDG